MDNEVIILGNNLGPPVICMETCQAVYECVKGSDFDVAKFNSLLMAVVTYLGEHDVDYGDKALPWAEEMPEA